MSKLTKSPQIKKIIRSKRKTLALEISPDAELIIRAPLYTPKYIINKFILQKINWILEKIELVKKNNKEAELLKNANQKKICFETAYKIISQRVRYYSSLSGFKYNKIKITKAKKRWGSCSYRNNLNFPMRLGLAPLEVIDYVAIHELCHIKEKNHSQKFWNEVEKLMPDYQKQRAWLKKNGHLLNI
ncbi:M48 family metallopeptidase [bacterium]|nr:M48 family metallopeptidase [bacterium]